MHFFQANRFNTQTHNPPLAADKRSVVDLNLSESAEAIVSILSSGRTTPIPARVLAASGNELILLIPVERRRGSALKIETGDALLLGELTRIETDGQGYRAALKIRHALKSLTELSRLNRAILGGREPQPAIAPRGRTELS